MNELLFFTGLGLIIILSYHLGHRNGTDINVKDEIRVFLHEIIVSRIAHDYLMRKALKDAEVLLKKLGIKNPKNVKVPKLMTLEEFNEKYKD
jgi:hypothetical protein